MSDKSIKDELVIKELLDKMPDDVAATFNDEQLTHLFTAVGTKNWARHTIDLRGTFKFPFITKRYYYVILFGQNKRSLSRYETELSKFTNVLFVSFGIVIVTLVGFIVLYLIKSALGIDLFSNYSLGLWTWVKSLWP